MRMVYEHPLWVAFVVTIAAFAISAWMLARPKDAQ